MWRITSLFRGASGVEGGDRRAIAQHGDAVGEGKDFLEFVRDVDAGRPRERRSRRMASRTCTSCSASAAVGSSRMRMRESLAQRLDDFHELLLPDAEAPARCAADRSPL